MQEKKYGFALALLIALYTVGFFGMRWAGANEWVQLLTPFESFLSLTPINLLLTAGLLLAFHAAWNMQFLAFFAISLLFGFGVEVAGVHTGAIFGQYWYGSTLGPKLWEVPPMIGVNWMVLAYCAGTIVQQYFAKLPLLIRALAGAVLMLGLDVLIEPVAMRYDFWQWQGGQIPLQNYVAWGLVAWLLVGIFLKLPFKKGNKMAMPVLLAQFAFFAVHHVALMLYVCFLP